VLQSFFQTEFPLRFAMSYFFRMDGASRKTRHSSCLHSYRKSRINACQTLGVRDRRLGDRAVFALSCGAAVSGIGRNQCFQQHVEKITVRIALRWSLKRLLLGRRAGKDLIDLGVRLAFGPPEVRRPIIWIISGTEWRSPRK